jgi:hypothetical protein
MSSLSCLHPDPAPSYRIAPQVFDLPSLRNFQPALQALHKVSVFFVPGTRWFRHVLQALWTGVQFSHDGDP